MSYKEKPQIKLFKFENGSFNQIAIIDDYQDCSFERNLYEAGQFSISINFNIPNSQLFSKGLFVQFGNDSYDFGIITKINDVIDQTGKGGQFRNITGYDARYIFKSRVIKNLNNNGLWECTSKAEYCLRKLIQDQCGVSCYEEKRKLPVKNIIKTNDVWENVSLPVTVSYLYLYRVCYSEDLNLFVAVGSSGTILTSPDGINWTQRSTDIGTIQLNYVYWCEQKNLFVIVGNGGVVLTSPDGINWTQRTSGVSTGVWCITYSEEKDLFIAVGYSGTIITSSDGITWTSQTSGVSSVFRGVTYSKKLDLFVIVGGSGIILTSSDGITWTQRTSGVSTQLWGIYYSKEKNIFITAGDSGVILISSDAIIWRSEISHVSTNLRAVSYSNSLNLFMIAGQSGTILSNDGIDWESKDINTTSNLYEVCYCEKLGISLVCGTNTTILINKDSEAVSNIGNECTVSESFSNLYDVCRNIATQNEIGWRLKFDNNELSLECYEGMNRSDSVQFSPSFDSLRDGNFTDSSESFVNSVYVGGKGNNEDKDLYEGESLINSQSPSGLDRFESYDNQSQLTTEDEYKNQADSLLTQYAQSLLMSGNGLSSCPYIYKEQYDVGDKIKFSFSNKTASVKILSITEHWSWNNYDINFSFGKPENTLSEQLQLMLRKIQKASDKTNAVESVKWYKLPDVNFMPSDDVTFDTIGFTGDVGTGFTFRLYLDSQKTGSKNYNIYLKNLTGTGKLTLTTGIEGTSNVELSAVNYVGMIFVDTEGNITSISASHANTADSATTAQTATNATNAETAQTATNATNAETAEIAKTSRMNDIIIAGNTPTQYAMTLTIPGFTANDLVAGKTIKVLFGRNTSSTNPTININSLGAHAIKVVQFGLKVNVPRHYGKWRGATSNSYERWSDETILELMYDGTYWVIVGNPIIENYDDSSGNGYRVYADGYIEQWGAYTGRGVHNITFCIQHTGIPFFSFCGNINVNASAIWSALGYNISQSGFTINWGADNTFMWSVHGY